MKTFNFTVSEKLRQAFQHYKLWSLFQNSGISNDSLQVWRAKYFFYQMPILINGTFQVMKVQTFARFLHWKMSIREKDSRLQRKRTFNDSQMQLTGSFIWKKLSRNGYNTILSNIKWTQKSLNGLECVHLLVFELEHLNFGFEQTDIEIRRPSLELLNYSSNRPKHHFCEHRTDSNVFVFW